MRFMVLVKASPESEAGQMPDSQLMMEMMKFNEEMVNAGILVAGEGLHPSSRAKRVRFKGSDRMVIDGPFTETKELIAGYWILQLPSWDDVVSWMRRCPNPHPGESEIEIRQIFEIEDFGAAATPEIRAKEAELRARSEAR